MTGLIENTRTAVSILLEQDTGTAVEGLLNSRCLVAHNAAGVILSDEAAIVTDKNGFSHVAHAVADHAAALVRVAYFTFVSTANSSAHLLLHATVTKRHFSNF